MALGGGFRNTPLFREIVIVDGLASENETFFLSGATFGLRSNFGTTLARLPPKTDAAPTRSLGYFLEKCSQYNLEQLQI